MDEFWDRHYLQFKVEGPSNFAQELIDLHLKSNDVLVELGCGNGRDGLSLMKHVSHYIGIDSSHQAVEQAKIRFRNHQIETNLFQLILGDFTSLDLMSLTEACLTSKKRLVVYSRFSLHSITASQQERLFASLAAINHGDVVIFFEARTIYDELFGVGELVERNAYVTDHYRRFIDPREFLTLIHPTYELESLRLARGFAQFGDENPKVMRAVLTRKEPENDSN